MNRKILKNNRGMALVSVLLVMVVASILIVSVLDLSLSDTKLAVNQEHRMQAQYIARAGADAAAKYVQDHSGEFNTFTTPKPIASTALGEGSFSGVIQKPFEGSLVILSTGLVEGITEQVKLSMAKGSYNSLFSGVRQTGFTPLDLGAMNITYEPGATVDIEANVDNLNDISLNGANSTDTNITKEINNESAGEIIMPIGYMAYTYKAEIDGDDAVGGVITVTGNKRIGSLSKGNNEQLVFETNGTDQNIVVDNIDIQGSHGTVEINGGGLVNLYILNSGAINTPVNANTGAPSLLFIHVADGKTLGLQANCELSAYIYAPNAIIEMQSDLTTVTGAMIGNILQKNGTGIGPHGNFHYVPLPGDVDSSGILYYVRDFYSN